MSEFPGEVSNGPGYSDSNSVFVHDNKYPTCICS